MIKYNVFKVCHPKGIPKGTKTFSRVWAWVLGGPKVVYWGWSGRRYVSPVGVCGDAVAMVMIGGSARWQRGPLLGDFGHVGVHQRCGDKSTKLGCGSSPVGVVLLGNIVNVLGILRLAHPMWCGGIAILPCKE